MDQLTQYGRKWTRDETILALGLYFQIPFAKIVGTCDYSSRTRNDLVLNAGEERNGKSTWDEGYDYWWDLSEVVCFERPIPCRGNVGMWQMPPVLATQVNVRVLISVTLGAAVLPCS